MRRPAILKGRTWFLLLSFLLVDTLCSRGQVLSQETLLRLNLRAMAGQIVALTRAFPILADASVAWAIDRDNDNGNDNTKDDNDNDDNDNTSNDNGNTNDNDNNNGNENSNVNDNDNEDNDNDNDNDNENDNEDGDNVNDNEDNDNENENDNDNGNDNDSPPVVEGEVIVQTVPGAETEVAERHRLTILEALEGTNIFRMGFAADRTAGEVLNELATDPDVQRQEPHYLAQSPEINPRSIAFIDPRSIAFIDGSSPGEYFDQEALQRIRAQEAQSFSRGRGVVVAVIDTGIDFQHPAFLNRTSSQGYDFVHHDADPSEACPPDPQSAPACGHGTFVAGIIALVAPEAKILPIQAIDEYGQGTAFNIAKAIRYATEKGATVINMSFGMPQFSFVIDFALQLAFNKGLLLVASAGNEGGEVAQYPAVSDRVIAVAATDVSDLIADFSNYGNHITVCAPGVGIYSTYPGSRFGIWSGTSFSAPFVAGEAALLYATTPRLTWRTPATRNRVSRTIIETAINIEANHPPAFAGKLGAGRIDVLEAVRRITGQSIRNWPKGELPSTTRESWLSMSVKICASVYFSLRVLPL